ncbi:hypothetical protein [Dyadobacter sp. 3J3]|uniref:hypothetical protein n=1 Tax=Dyadobacter sp. 3J3 TaxID=2606600 RepID=UPI001356BD3D|nr:hypothetical protein [Dyadobacter sp. 3J3]
MKNLIFALIGILYLGSARAQVTVTFPAGNIASEEWVKSLVTKKIDSLSTVHSNGTKNIPDSVVPLPNCLRGPTIQSITFDTMTGISILFDGKDVFGLDYLLLGPIYEIVTKGSLKPTSNIIKIGYQSLPPGDYHLTVTANTCTGKDSKDFTIKKK